MPTADQFLQRAMREGYSVDEITEFLQSAEKSSPKQKQAMQLVETANDIMTRQRGESKGLGDYAAQGAKTAAGIAIPAALTYAAAGPIAGALGGMGAEAAGALGAGEAMAGAEGAAGLKELLGKLDPKMMSNLYKTYKKQGPGAALASLAGQGLSAMGQSGQPQGAEQAQGVDLPPELQQEALADLQQQGDPDPASAMTHFRILESAGHPLKNLAKTIEKKSGKRFKDVVFDFLSTQVQGQDVDLGLNQMAEQQGMAQGGLSQMPDDQLMQLMKQRGLL